MNEIIKLIPGMKTGQEYQTFLLRFIVPLVRCWFCRYSLVLWKIMD